MADLLEVEGLSAGYGEAVVLTDISLKLHEGQALALLGRNGTGKTTLINTIIGLTRRRAGTIRLGGIDITRLRPDQRALAPPSARQATGKGCRSPSHGPD